LSVQKKSVPLQPLLQDAERKYFLFQTKSFICMMNHYETAFILTPVLSDAQMKEAVEKFKNFLVESGAEIENEELWGLRKLAYPIQKKSTGFYALLQFKGEPSLVAGLETQFRRDERVLRFLTFRLDKYALEYAQKRINKTSNQQQEEK
jgi:small subunit ribosomal protein S6